MFAEDQTQFPKEILGFRFISYEIRSQTGIRQNITS